MLRTTRRFSTNLQAVFGLAVASFLGEAAVSADRAIPYFQGVASGGLNETFEYGARNDYFLNVNGEKAGLWKGSFITLHGETRYGESVNRNTGTLLPANLALALPQPGGTVTALTGVKFMQFLSEDMLVFAGKINTFDDFKQQLTGAGLTNGFINTAMMINPVLVRTIPYSTFGAGLVSVVRHSGQDRFLRDCRIH